ncbi:MAG TPA: CheR family methyltransferase [Vicinamibacterales bacterium]
MSDGVESQFDALLEYLRRTRGFDFGAYKRPSLMRRVQKRMQAVGLEQFADYTDFLEVHPEEFGQLFNVILINVTAFFRDDQAWAFIRDSVIPSSVDSGSQEPVRVWTAGCASGEETYSLAMLLAEAMGRDQFRDRVKIYATDVDEQALNQARAASYNEKQVAAVPPELLDRYFTLEGDRFVFDKDLRRSVIFGRHDLVQDAPISRVNILLCRNALMYFNTEAQSRILARFHFALAPNGVLFLGKAEMLLTHSQLFVPIDLRRRIFRKLAKDNWRERMAVMNLASGDEVFGVNGGNHSVYPAAFDAAPNAQFIIDNNGLLALFNEKAGALFNLVPTDIGRPVQDLEVSYRPVEVRSLMAQAAEQRRPIVIRETQWESPGRDTRYFDVHVVALFNDGNKLLGVSMSFVDVSRTQELQVLLNRSKQDLETAYEELQSTNEELETTNEELQSTVEELETTNEELQSTNEELETMNEELQSTNEELQTINEELRERSDDLNRANGLLESILTGVRSGVVVLDRELHVLAWNHRAEDLWGLRAEEVRGQNFLNLDIGLPTELLRSDIRFSLGNAHEFKEHAVSATNRRGRAITCRVTISSLVGDGQEIRGVILMMDEQNHKSSSSRTEN